jgi:hypothetical protein
VSRVRTARAASAAAHSIVVGVCLTLGACALNRRPAPRAADPATLAAEQWPETRRVALNGVLVHNIALADSVLRAFAGRFPGTPAAAETVYLRALLRLDPTGEGTPTPEALRDVRTLLDAYIAGGPLQEHYVESVVLRRVTTRFDSLYADADAARAASGVQAAQGALLSAAARDSMKARDDELTRLRTELDATKAELERIRRRLAPPRP